MSPSKEELKEKGTKLLNSIKEVFTLEDWMSWDNLDFIPAGFDTNETIMRYKLGPLSPYKNRDEIQIRHAYTVWKVQNEIEEMSVQNTNTSDSFETIRHFPNLGIYILTRGYRNSYGDKVSENDYGVVVLPTQKLVTIYE